MEQLRLGTVRGRWVLAATVLGSAMAQLDGTVVNVALPRIGNDLSVGLSSLQWVVTAYTLTLAAFLLLGGGLGDRYGRRKVFTIGVAWFALASVLCAAAPGAPLLIAARALQGVGAALLTPGSLAILQTSFASGDRGAVIGAWSGLTGAASAIGPFIGGWLLNISSWRWIFLINIPLAAGVLAISARHVPESRGPRTGGAGAVERTDWSGGIVAALALGALTYGLIEGPARHWTALPLVLLLLGLMLMAGFLLMESRKRHPMLPLGLFRSRQFCAANGVTFAMYGAMGAFLFLVPVQLQTVAGYSPLEAGVSLLPVTALMLLLSARSGALAARIGPRLQMSVGPILLGCGILLLIRVGTSANYLTTVFPAAVVVGLGLSTTVAPLTTAALSTVPGANAGIASAINNDVARTAGLLAVAILPGLAGITGDDYQVAASFNAGFQHAAYICAGLVLLAGVLAALTIRNTGGAAPAATTATQEQAAQPEQWNEPARPSCAALDGAPLSPVATAPRPESPAG